MKGWAMMAVLSAATAGSAQPADTERLYVATQGNDAWSGRLAEANAEGTDGPLATPAGAQAVVRRLKAGGLAKPVEVAIEEGRYALGEPLVFGPEDSGTEACPITYRAAEGARPILSGGQAITGWERREDGLWSAKVPGWSQASRCFRVLRVGEKWATRARHPNYDPAQPYTGGWLFADYGGEPWERGMMGVGVSNTHTVGARLTWCVRIPADGQYRVWLRYGHKMKDYHVDDMAEHAALKVDDGPFVPLENLPDTGSWDATAWAYVCSLDLAAGERVLTWENQKGGGINLDAWVLTEDDAWDPNAAIGQPTWWGAVEVKPAAEGKHVLLIQCEACETAEGAEISVPKPTPPGTVADMRFREGDLPDWRDPAGSEVHVFIAWGWVNAIVPVERVEPAERKIVFVAPGATQDVRMGNRYFVENVREALDAPGEWYLDEEAGEVLYLPDDAQFPTLPVVAAQLERLIVLEGKPVEGRFVEHVRFEGLRFADTDYSLTQDYYGPADATVTMSGARHCAVRNCEFGWNAGYALKLTDRSEQCRFERNQVHDMGQGGVIMVGDSTTQPHHCSIAGNAMERLGLIYKHVAGVYVTTGSDHRIAHNRIIDVPRYGISLKTFGGGSASHRNVIEFNDLRRTNLETNDTGAIETLGRDREDTGNIIRHNLMLDSVGLLTTPEGRILTPYFTWGVYLDDYSSGTTVYGNIVARTVVGGVCIHGGRSNDIRNNVFVDASEQQVRLQPRDDFMQGNRFANNIAVYPNPEATLIFSWRRQEGMFAEFDRNLYFLRGADLKTLATRNTFEGTFADWLAAGYDANSVVADPLFVDAEHDDYRLKAESPAFGLGFQAIPVERIGPEGMEDGGGTTGAEAGAPTGERR